MNQRAAFLGAAILGLALMAGASPGQTAEQPMTGPGEQAYLAHCAVCHGVGGAGDGPLAARIREQGTPPPAQLSDAARMRALGRKGVLAVVSGGGAHAGRSAGMPVWGPHLGTRIMARICDHVLTLPAPAEAAVRARDRYLESPGGSSPEGRRAYVLYCSGCHGRDGKGDGYFSPALRRTLAPGDLTSKRLAALSDDELRKCVGLGGAHAAQAPTMPGWINTLEPGTVEVLVSYLRTLSRPGERR